MTTKFASLLFYTAQVTGMIDIETSCPLVAWERICTEAIDERSPEKKSKRQKKFTLFIGLKC